tara:strand:+ start:516 stop:767 length:252 start_codon:yes stop_codon:yes gene_type:complete
MTEIDVQEDLQAIVNQIENLVDEMRKLDQTRDTMMTQIANLNGVAMYLRGKTATETPVEPVEEVAVPAEDDLERSAEYPTETS